MTNCSHDIPSDIECPNCVTDALEQVQALSAHRLTVGDVMTILKELEQRYIQDQRASYEPTSYYESCRNKEDAIADAISAIEYRMKYGA